VFLLGGAQTDFALNVSREGKTIYDLMAAAVDQALDAVNLSPSDVEVAHIGNFAGELFTGQGHLGGLFASIHPAFTGLPTSRHEAACASGSVAVLAAAADIAAGHYDVACVVGIEQMRNVTGKEAAAHLGAAAWVGREAVDAKFPWPHLFSRIGDAY